MFCCYGVAMYSPSGVVVAPICTGITLVILDMYKKYSLGRDDAIIKTIEAQKLDNTSTMEKRLGLPNVNTNYINYNNDYNEKTLDENHIQDRPFSDTPVEQLATADNNNNNNNVDSRVNLTAQTNDNIQTKQLIRSILDPDEYKHIQATDADTIYYKGGNQNTSPLSQTDRQTSSQSQPSSSYSNNNVDSINDNDIDQSNHNDKTGGNITHNDATSSTYNNNSNDHSYSSNNGNEPTTTTSISGGQTAKLSEHNIHNGNIDSNGNSRSIPTIQQVLEQRKHQPATSSQHSSSNTNSKLSNSSSYKVPVTMYDQST